LQQYASRIRRRQASIGPIFLPPLKSPIAVGVSAIISSPDEANISFYIG